jgi:Na+/melibiose symporter-like transporter
MNPIVKIGLVRLPLVIPFVVVAVVDVDDNNDDDETFITISCLVIIILIFFVFVLYRARKEQDVSPSHNTHLCLTSRSSRLLQASGLALLFTFLAMVCSNFPSSTTAKQPMDYDRYYWPLYAMSPILVIFFLYHHLQVCACIYMCVCVYIYM